ncbi:ABC transporter permease [Petrotoga sp. 9PWA.NaAc.5.4]|uniref:ABC transporter permease n=1 Tax=Petrotoga sp. 9PWA.NaAc.5.4 TaxID=1434328 RepID=UPI000EFCAF5F|nr:ABC transporter permease [Petrotoga sp. 9PWA.NaAc.5.4]
MKKNILTESLKNRNIILLFIFIVIFLYFSIFTRDFFNYYNIVNLTKYGVEIGLLALAETLIIISGKGGIDLSIGSILSLSAMTIGVLGGRMGINIWISVLVGIGVATLAGLLNGIAVSLIKIPPLLVTLSTMYIYDSIALLISMDQYGNAMPISNFPENYLFLGQKDLFNIPLQLIIVFIPIIIILHLILSKTVYGKRLYAIGSNDKVAKFSGIPNNRVRIIAYTLGGFLAGIAAMVMTSRIASARPDLGANLNLRAITIAVLGGTNIIGGEGTIIGTVIAIFLITVLNNGMQLSGVNPIWQDGVLGIILVASAIVNFIIYKKMNSSKS